MSGNTQVERYQELQSRASTEASTLFHTVMVMANLQGQLGMAAVEDWTNYDHVLDALNSLVLDA